MSSHAAEPSGDSVENPDQVTFNIKASNDQKFVLTLPKTTLVSELKTKLSTSEYADVPAERIRLIYSGRVLKDNDTLATYKVVDGNTIHMVKGAASNARQNPAASSSTTGNAPAAPAVPNMATGTGNNPLAGLTGARYAGFHGLPNASMFGADGGMGAPPGPDDMLRMLDDPNFAQVMNESMNNPAVIQMLEQQPMIANNPMLRDMIRDPNMRRMLFNPEMMRAQLQMQRAMGGRGGGEGAFPMPGATDTTQGGNTATPQGGQGTGSPPSNPFAGMFGGMPGAQGGAAGANPFAALFGAPPAGNAGAQGTTGSTSPPPAGTTDQTPSSTNPDQAQQQNPFAGLFGGQGGNEGIYRMANQMMQNPEMMNAMFGGGAGGAGAGAGGAQGQGGQGNPFASLFGPGGFGGMGGMGGAAQPQDDRPPEERYAEQLRQLNDMGFFEFDRNIQALRRSGGSVQGAIEFLLGGGS